MIRFRPVNRNLAVLFNPFNPFNPFNHSNLTLSTLQSQPPMSRRDHYLREKKERELRDRLRSTVLALAERSAGSREHAAAIAEFARGRAELRKERETRTRARVRREAGRPAPWDSPRALARRLAAWDVADARWTDWAERTVLAARAGAEPPLAPGEHRRAGTASDRLCKRSLAPAPDAAALRAAWAAARGGRGRTAETIRLGSLLLDLEASLGSRRTRGADGRIAGRQPGLRGWIARYAPDLAPRYDSLLRARRLAQAMRRAYGLRDPLPATLLLGDGGPLPFPGPLRERIERAQTAARALLASPAGRAASALAPALARRARPDAH